MGAFRDDREAALARADALEVELERHKAELDRARSENERLRDEVAAAHGRESEHARLLDAQAPPPGAWKPPPWWELLLRGRPSQPRFVSFIAMAFALLVVGMAVAFIVL